MFTAEKYMETPKRQKFFKNLIGTPPSGKSSPISNNASANNTPAKSKATTNPSPGIVTSPKKNDNLDNIKERIKSIMSDIKTSQEEKDKLIKEQEELAEKVKELKEGLRDWMKKTGIKHIKHGNSSFHVRRAADLPKKSAGGSFSIIRVF